MSYGTYDGIQTGNFKISGIWDGYGPKKIFYVSKEFYDKSGWKLSQAASGRYFIDFKQKFMTTKEQNAFIESMNLGKQQNVFFIAGLGNCFPLLVWADWTCCCYLPVCLFAYL